MTPEVFQMLAPTLPEEAGVYRFVAADQTVLYVGKAKNLRKRLASYFTKSDLPPRTQVMVRRAASIEYTVVTSEQDALLLENELIKRYQPRYNVNLRDDKTYPWIAILNEPFPRVILTRRPDRRRMSLFGPYTSVHTVREILDFIRKMYPLRTCSLALTEKNIASGRFRVCLEYHIGNCKGPCEGRQSAEDYQENIRQIRKILRGDIGEVQQALHQRMMRLAAEYRFEEAEQVKRQLQHLEHYQSHSLVVHPSINDVDVFAYFQNQQHVFLHGMHLINGVAVQSHTLQASRRMEEPPEEVMAFLIHEWRRKLNSQAKEIIVPFAISFAEEVTVTVPQRGDKKKLLDLATRNLHYYVLARQRPSNRTTSASTSTVLLQLQQDFGLSELPTHIECFDNSNFQGSEPVAALVVFRNAKPSKKDYRHYNIRTVRGPDDFASMAEIVYRRYRRLLEEHQPLPQLIIIDGGKGQLSAALSSLQKLNLNTRIKVCAIAKRLEEIYFPEDPLPLYLDKKSPSLRLIQQIRNEAHRFALSHHRNRRSRAVVKTELTDIAGIGPKTAEALLRHFRSVAAIRQADENTLAQIVGSHRAKRVYAYFHPEPSNSSNAEEHST
ncbi:MAG: excinuclease ABC subunit UvrC [Chitinophagales bacterium]|nr:excinuclease ABC subunit UvrC [Chitinophagales bacterium]MDW8426964.1 excinuclease ABC subunit UvrC [Chitinophagales bacterium]